MIDNHGVEQLTSAKKPRFAFVRRGAKSIVT